MSCLNGAIVTFDYSGWNARYPQFSNTVSAELAPLLFNEAVLFLDNLGASPITDPATQSMLLNMLVAHMAALEFGENGSPASGIVGRISSASEGSVSVQASYSNNPSPSEAFFTQTKYGARFWAATDQYRKFSYVDGPRAGEAGPFDAFDPRRGIGGNDWYGSGYIP